MKFIIFDFNQEHRMLLKEAIELQEDRQVFMPTTIEELLRLVKEEHQVSKVILDPWGVEVSMISCIYDCLINTKTQVVIHTTTHINELWKAGFPKKILYAQKPYPPFDLINIGDNVN